MQGVSEWPNICSLCLSFVVFLLYAGAENYLGTWAVNFVDTSILRYNVLTPIQLTGISSLVGILCQVYQCLSTMDKLSAVVMLLWSLLFVIHNFEILLHFHPKVYYF